MCIFEFAYTFNSRRKKEEDRAEEVGNAMGI